MNRRSFFAAVGGLALGGALPEQKVEAKPVEFVDAPNIYIRQRKYTPKEEWAMAHGITPLYIQMWGDEDAEYRLVARKVS